MSRFAIPIGTGAKRHRLTLQTLQTITDEFGQETKIWTSGQTYWGMVNMTEGHQVVNGGQVKAERTGQITMRYFGPVNGLTQRFNFNGRLLHIISIDDVGERHREYRIQYREIVGEES